MAKKYLVGNAHLDPAWLWRWQEGYTEVLTTFRSMLDRLKEFPYTTFTSACAVYYQWVEETDPAMFQQIREMVRQGRWNIVGGWYLQPDCNMPDGESFLRHSLIAQRYFKEKFGITVKTGYNVDSFGHNAGLPKILRASGMENYVFMRPSTAEQGCPERVFHWESDDGSSVLAYRIPHFYNITVPRLHLVEELAAEADATGNDVMLFYGIGNHGGGPSIELLDAMKKLPVSETVYSGPDAFFENTDSKTLPVIAGELQHHARGCYSAETSIKTLNRRAEQSLLAAEAYCSMAKHLVGAQYPADELRRGWKNVLFNQFHDILCGCSIKSVYEDARHQLGETVSLSEKAINLALQRIAWNIDTLQGNSLPSYKSPQRFTIWEHETLGTPVTVFNAHPWPVRQCVRVNAKATCVTDVHGKELPFQLVRSDTTDPGNTHNTLFTAEVPPMGYAVYRVFCEKPGELPHASAIRVSETVLENDKIRVELDSQTGDVCRIYDKTAGTCILDHVCKAVLVDETLCDTWAHDRDSLGPTVDSFRACGFEVLEQGSVRGCVRVVSRGGNSLLERTYIITEGSDTLTVKTRVDFHEQHKALKFTFPMTDETVTAKIPCGTIRRKGYTGEEPCGTWFASGGICVANDCKYGYDTQDGEMRMTVMRGAIYANHYGQRDNQCEFMDQGIHEFTYSILPMHSISQCERRAAELNSGLRLILGGFHKGSLPECISCLEGLPENIRLAAVKQHEDGDGTVVRIYEMEGKDSDVSLTLFGNTIKTHIPAFGLQTLDDSGRTLNAMEWEL